MKAVVGAGRGSRNARDLRAAGFISKRAVSNLNLLSGMAFQQSLAQPSGKMIRAT